MSGKYTPLPNHFSNEMKTLISKLLVVEEKDRPGINELLRMPLMAKRVRAMLEDDVFFEEFSHTVLH